MAKRLIRSLTLMAVFLMPVQAFAVLKVEITGGSDSALPIAIVPFGAEGQKAPEDLTSIIRNDLESSGRFAPLDNQDLVSRPTEQSQVNFADWRLLRSEGLVIGKISSQDGENYQVQFQLFDVFRGQQLAGKRYQVPASGLRALGHQIADVIYETLTGEKGIFSTRLAFVTQITAGDGKKRFALQISDADGANPRTVLQSTQPIMSPSWAPDGNQLAYVSFENGKTEVFVQQLLSGQRKAVASFDGINSAPAWSPDGRKLALTLSRNGNPEIYVLELSNGDLIRVTNNAQAIDTEAVWSRDGNDIYFTSDRGGRPQIYKVSANGGRAERISFEGNYNASPDLSPDGSKLTMVHGANGGFYIAVQDLKTGSMQVLTESGRAESPSFAPNGQMILYATEQKGSGVLAAVSVDGRIHQRLSESGTVVREPAWSPLKK